MIITPVIAAICNEIRLPQMLRVPQGVSGLNCL